MDNYTKINDNVVAKYGIKVAYIYAKLCYRMRLSKRSKKFYNNGYFVIYKLKDLQHDCHLGYNAVVNGLKKLVHAHLLFKVPTMFANRLYLPAFNKKVSTYDSQTHESLKNKRPKEQITNNQDLNNNLSVNSSSCSSVNKAKPKKHYPNMDEIKKRFKKPLVDYAINHILPLQKDSCHPVYSPVHFIYGVLRRWQRKGLKTLNDVMVSEHDCHGIKFYDPNGPEIPLFKI